MLIPGGDALDVDFVLVVGLGKQADLHLDTIRNATGAAIQIARQYGLGSVVAELLGEDIETYDPLLHAKAMTEAALLASYAFTNYKDEKPHQKLVSLTLVIEDANDVQAAKKGIELAETIIDGVTVARDLVNTPGQDMTPKRLAAAATEIAKLSAGAVTVKILGRKECEKRKMGAYLAVAQGSHEEPQFIHLSYKPEKRAKKRIALIGKGVTFDSGGLSIKPSSGMETMKCDMAGGAAVLGTFATLARLRPEVEIHGIIAATENMPSDTAIRPGDIVRASNGMSIEILNTDAEGRLTLADALHYAAQQKPEVMIDLATLTGACVVALGEEISAAMSTNDELRAQILSAANRSGENMWPMPLEKNYAMLMESDIADLRNISTSRYGGSLTAGLFLKNFVPEEIPWVHLDIAGPAFAERPIGKYLGKGATGYGVRTLVEYIRGI